MNLFRIILISITFVLLLPVYCFSQTLEDALQEAADYFAESNSIDLSQQLIIGVQNYHSKKKDKTAELIETELYLALEKALPGAKMFLESQALAGVSSTNTIYFFGTYEQKGQIITLRLQALKGMISGEVLDQTSVSYSTDKSVNKALVAVLDIEADTLTEAQRKGFSQIFRAALAQSEQFYMTSGAEIDKMDADQIQSATGCTRDECATVIGEQLGVDRVISSSFTKLTENMFVLSARMMDIRNGSIIATETVKHSGSLETLDQALENLSVKLSHSSDSVQFINNTGSDSFRGGIERITPKFSGDQKSNVAALILNTIPSNANVYFGEIKAGTTPYQNMRLKPGQQLKVTLKHPDMYDKNLVMTLKGGINEVGSIKLNSRYGSLLVNSNPQGASVYLAGEKVGTTPYRNNHILSGSYLISIDYPFYFSEENRQVIIQAEKQTTKQFLLKPNFGTLNIETNPPNTEIKIYNQENKLVSKSSSSVENNLTPGEYRLEISKKGYDPLDFNITIAKGKTETISESEATLRKLEGYLLVSSIPYQKGADVMIDGEKKSKVPANLTLPVGNYTVEVISENKTGTSQITIQDGLTESLTIDIYDRFSRQELIDQHNYWNWKWGLSLVGSLAIGYGALSENQKAQDASDKQKSEEDAISTSSNAEDAGVHRDQAKEYNNDVKTYNQNAQINGLISIGLLGLTAWIYLDEPKNPESVHWQPEIKPDGNFRISYSVAF
jgi:hypothetical protein